MTFCADRRLGSAPPLYPDSACGRLPSSVATPLGAPGDTWPGCRSANRNAWSGSRRMALRIVRKSRDADPVLSLVAAVSFWSQARVARTRLCTSVPLPTRLLPTVQPANQGDIDQAPLHTAPYRQVRDAKQARVIGRWLHPTASPFSPDRPHQRAYARRLAARSHPRQRGAAGTRRPVTTPRTNWTSVPSAGPASWHARDSSGIRG